MNPLLTFRALLCVALFGIAVLLPGCDSSDPSDPQIDPPDEDDLFLLEPTYFSNFSFPSEGRGPLRILDPIPTSLTFEVASGAFTQGEVTTETREVGFMSALTDLGYNALSISEAEVPDYAVLTLEAPAGADLTFLEQVEVVFSADGLPTRSVIGTSYPYGTEAELYIDSYAVREYLRQPSFRVQLVLRAYQNPPVAGTYRFGFRFETRFYVYDGDPAPAEVTFERELRLRDALQQEGFDVGDVVSARVTKVAVLDESGMGSASLLDERVEEVRIRLGSPETEETEEVAVMQDFDPVPHPYYSGPVAGARADLDVDVTAIVRRTGRLLLTGVLDLDEAATARGEYYPILVEVEVAFEVPIPEGPRAGGFGARTVELRVPMRLRSDA